MRILVTNDDGIDSPALSELARSVADLGEITVAAPATQQSACGHGLTVHGILEVEQVDIGIEGISSYAVHGKPADCVKLACRVLMDDMPDLVLSGINIGANVGINALYSGTVAGAAEAVILGIPAVAFSIETRNGQDCDIAASARWSRRVLDSLLASKALDSRWFCNVNFPAGCNIEPVGVRVCPQCDATVWENYRQLPGFNSRQRYQLTSDYGFNEPDAASDAAAIAANYVTLTPMAIDLTSHRMLDKLLALEFKL